MEIINIITYLVLIIFIVSVTARMIKIATSPVHLRWELYPVPHEKGKAEYGGSRLEESDWWEKKIHKDHIGEVKAMAKEIVLLKGVWEHNKSLWFGSFPFHFALYLYIVNIFLFLFSGILYLNGVNVSTDASFIASAVYYLILILAWTGTILGVIGSIRLLFSRMTESRLASYSSPSHYFNIVIIGGIYLTALIWLIADKDFVLNLTVYYSSLLTFTGKNSFPAIGYWHVGFCLFFIAYLPFTHMTHFFTKYFTYHKVRWEDAPNVSGSKLHKKIFEQLNQVVTWSAPHIGADGSKTWLAIAANMPGKEEK